ncbi:transglutaminase domain-containing protein [Homoserinimonas sp. A447]
MARSTVSPGFIAINTVMVWATFAVAGATLWPIYQSERLIILIAASLIAGSAIAILGAVYRWSSIVVMLVAIASYLLLGVPLAVPDQALYGVLPSLGGMVDLLAGSAVGWKQLLTITLPVGSFEALLVPALLLMLFGTVIGLSIALRARYGEVAVIVPAIILVLAVTFGPESTDWPMPLTLALLVLILVWLIWARWYRRRASIRLLVGQPASGKGRAVESRDTRLGFRALLGSALTMTLAVGIALGGVWLFPVDTGRQVLRAAVEEPFDPRDHASPLSGFRAYHQVQSANRPMFMVEGLPEGAMLRVAALDTYDGIVYSVGSDQVSSLSGSFVRVPTTFDQSGVAGDEISVQVTVDQYQGIWMPSIGKLESVTFAGPDAADLRGSFFYNDNSGTAVVVEGLSEGDSYRFQAVVPSSPTPGQLAALEPGSATVPQPAQLPDELALALSGYVGEAETAGARLQAMIDGLRADGYISHGVDEDEPASRSGHAADRITQLLTGQRMIGDAEQYAVTAALMAGQLGFPARVVLGFAPDHQDSDSVVTVLGEDVSAWIEVNTSRHGWVAINPNPDPREIPEEEPEDPTQVARPQSPVQPPPTEPDFTVEQVQPDSSQEDPELPNEVLAILLAIAQVTGMVLLGAAILMSPFLAVAVAKLRRRSLRRRATSPITRVAGGWQEFEDAVLDHGYNPPPMPTRAEVARTVGGTRSLVLASVADRAVFSPDSTEDSEAEKVWRAVDELRQALGQGRTRWQRIKALVSVRSLGGYSVKSLFRRKDSRLNVRGRR